MKKVKLFSMLATMILAVVFISSCEKEVIKEVEKIVEVEASTYTISGVVTYPDFGGTSTNADGAVVYMKVGATEATTSYDMTTIADATGKYTFAGLSDSSYFVFANYDTENTNNPGGRIAGIIFGGEGGVVTVDGANATQNIELVSLGQADAIAVNTYDGGDWGQDWNHSNVDFSFPYDGANATYTGRFRAEEIYIDFDPFDLGSSKIEATIDILSVITDSPGGRDPLYSAEPTGKDEDGEDTYFYIDPVTGEYNLGCIHGTLGMENDNPTSANRYSTFVSTSIEAYGDGYLATADFTVNGVTAPVSMYFKYIPGFIGEDRGENPTQFSSFQGTFDFAAFQVFGIASGHIGEENDVTINASFQVTKAL